MKEIVEKIHPDIVLLCLSQNDLSDALQFVDYTVVNGYRISKKQMPQLPLWIKAILLNFKSTYYWGERFYALMGKLGRVGEENLRLSETIIYQKVESEQINKGLSKMNSLLLALKSYCLSESITLTATYVPSRNEIYNQDWSAFTETYNLNADEYNTDLAEDRYRELLILNDIPYLPIKSELSIVSQNSAKRLYFEKDNHWNKYGIEKAAKSLAQQLVDYLP